MAVSVLQAGPMVQMILARRGEEMTAEAIDSSLLTLNLSPQSELLNFRIFIVET
jgi:hypothetical protein